ncbi:PREDICTED: serine/threonine-protein kinase-like protein At1g28390 [Nicotiana attenuata]|nr:PREDICTED: serine/threonine-protein kinase-like protein At1g28390 [Nicotiana attenuata]
MADDVEALLLELGKLDSNIFLYERDNIRCLPMARCGRLDPEDFIQNYKRALEEYDAIAKEGPSQGFNVGDAKNLSHDELEKITNRFCEKNFIQHIGYGRLFRGFIDDGEGMREVTVKTSDFIFPGVISYDSYPRKFRDEIVLLERSEFKSHPWLMKLIGFCFDKKLAVVYDMKFKTPLWDAVRSAEFGWKERMKVATDYALLLITLSRKQFDVWCNGCTDSMMDEV